MEKPFLRGHFHQAAFFIAMGAAVMLIAQSSEPGARIANAIYTAGLLGLFGISALYHRPSWSPAARQRMRKLDHSGIFILIAATATPVALFGLGITQAREFLCVMWAAAVLGIAQSLFWIRAPKWIAPLLCVSAGWLLIPYWSNFRSGLGTQNLKLLLWGGIIYTLGAIIYAVKKPNPFPRIFGYHEVFHLLVVVAATLHFIMVARLTL